MDIRQQNEFRGLLLELKSILLETKEDIAILKAESEKKALTPKEVQEMLGIGKTTYQRYVKDNIITQSKIGGKAYVQRSEIQRLFEEGKI
ncbi:helix-turn-helix domain-containing protein [Bacteroides propionicifaciens]|uniref:helix-turn-helix domain-containing protein n=1 Tax=Bacteroides propionicifaciens TaxID=392838 RepID=UPI00035DE56A|nr:helix-turn-helix domain-containing protein [Bacteroides propionicifaciens]